MFYFGIAEKSNEERCNSPPEIGNGYYRPYYGGMGETDFAVGTELQAACEPSFILNCPHQKPCGRIVCSGKGTWRPKDQPLINCAATPQTVVSGNSRDIRSDDVHGSRNTSSTQNYLILALAMVCIVGVAALTIALLRRPLFCKKRDQSPSDPHVVVTSSSPHHGGGGEDYQNSIVIGMNTGIFVPGADYNLQDYHLQDGPLCGTQIFK
ncbi:hypothetical protein Fcan01_05873 [Folsomia candida]|uniref:Sushi domain-containing protein n=1 Tax=Folsomia candida TaxID=158441 RepID=A0A226EQT3_FOLCA|nr:hypothetical protein Fcan01_05873 [Folsomia candida]